ncbi:bifunctional 3-phenylpropionate/cinnamic acid dioxygenase ferredoxin subunit [Kineococcus gynurae]|uniref:Bifunctional 3-phenylpropionate/cinnamic acid dioxygenase ferredoxin subunit n=1 Tax=Kineococcus gynurae TaxID=452979 RepID=A0ABV5LS10_9ACTN
MAAGNPDEPFDVIACPVAALPPGGVNVLDLPRPVSVFNVDGDLFAIDDTCTHAEASLAEGWVEDCAVECPLHAATFDLRTGQPSGPPAIRPVRTHAVEIVDGQVVVHVGTPPA